MTNVIIQIMEKSYSHSIIFKGKKKTNEKKNKQTVEVVKQSFMSLRKVFKSFRDVEN